MGHPRSFRFAYETGTHTVRDLAGRLTLLGEAPHAGAASGDGLVRARRRSTRGVA